LTACSSSDDVAEGGNAAPGEPQYLAISIQNVTSGPSAAGAKAATRANTAGTFENGTESEQKINKVRFYFFNQDGTPFALSNNGGHNWLEKTGTELGSNASTGNVELTSNAVLVLESNTGASPASMIAVVNPETLSNYGTNPLLDGTSIKDLTVTQMKSDGLQATSFYNKNTTTDFVMTNSVYDDNGTNRCAAMTSGHIMTSKQDALDNPVVVYVERVNAKVRTHLKEQGSTLPTELGKCGTLNYQGKDYPAYYVADFHGKKIYALVQGWGVADENPLASLEKNIGDQTNWTDWVANSKLGISPSWTSTENHRSYWELSVGFGTGTGDNKPLNHSWNEYKAELSTTGTSLYTLPNTQQNTNGYDNCDKNTAASPFTKALVKAVLVENVGDDATPNYQPATICSYKSLDYASMSDLQTAIAAEYQQYYTKGTDGSYTSLQASDISFSTKAQAGNTKSEPKDYQVVPCLADASKTYYKNTGASESPAWTEVDASVINSEMDNYVADVRNAGRVYYYTCIRHLAPTKDQIAYLGVVRNHIYDINITGIQGLGTPVYDPDKIIEPIVPSNAATFLAAQLNVLAWGVVEQEANLDATK
jgi:hypothetical protein